MRQKAGFFKALCIAIIFLFTQTAIAAPGITWRSYSSSVFEQAKKDHRLVLIYGKSEFCHWCQKMNKEAWADPTVQQIVSAHYIPVAVDIDEDSTIANQYQITATPTLIILDANNNIVKVSYGYSEPRETANLLTGAYR